MNTRYFDGDTFTREGRTFRVRFPRDDSDDAPWERGDGHGAVSDWTRRAKRPGEWVLLSDRGSRRYYDAAEAQRLALRDGWGLAPDDIAKLARLIGRTPTRGDIAAECVARDFDYLRRWCADDWCYVGVVVELIDADGDAIDERSLWGIESDATEYLAETAHELADEVLRECRKTWRAALREARERRYWATRDVQTARGAACA